MKKNKTTLKRKEMEDMSYEILRQPTKSNQIGTRIDKLQKKNGDQSCL